MKKYYNYIYLNPLKPGKYKLGKLNFCLLYEPFYVGKGQGDRYLQHIKECFKTEGNRIFKRKDSLKCNKLTEILKELLKTYSIEDSIKIIGNHILVFGFSDKEETVLKNEKIMINQIGCIKDKRGSLVNLKDVGVRMNFNSSAIQKNIKKFKGL